MTKRFSGIFTPIATPFRDDDTLNEAALRSNVARWMTTSLTGLVVLGSNGEAPTLDDDEADRIIDIVRDGVPKDRPLIAGTGRESTRATIDATRRAAAAGIDAALVRTPSFFKPQMTSDAFVRHYTDVADASPIPVLLYNVTLYTGVNLLPDAVERLATHPNIVGMKESGGDIAQIAEFVGRTPDHFTVLAGSATTLVHALSAGCDGAILALAALAPDACQRMLLLVKDRKLDEANALQRELLPLARSVGGLYGVPGLKAALDLMGYVGGSPRPPLRSVSSKIVELISDQLGALGVISSSLR
ncbi:MAG TPA: dihydrodipicolinate synthase family protein [Vicinamibacterales bacterium]|jgi:4-hydroxy-2-oxoglutarate aldolase